MEYLRPHIILRRGLIAGNGSPPIATPYYPRSSRVHLEYPHLAEHISEFLASTLFFTSELFLKTDQKRKNVGQYHRNGLVHLTEEVCFTTRCFIGALS